MTMQKSNISVKAFAPVTKFTDLMHYFKISDAASLLDCSPEELLHLGATGRLEITAPVVLSGEFSWPSSIMESGLIEVDAPFVRFFDASSRVTLFPSDLARIEAVGWAIPWRFYSPLHSQEALKNAPRTYAESLASRYERRSRLTGEFAARFPGLHKGQEEMRSHDSESADTKWGPQSAEYEEESLIPLREAALYSPWITTEGFDENSSRTTIEHLFISRNNLFQLRDGTLQDRTRSEPELTAPKSKSTHGNTERYSKMRYEILFAAIWAYRNQIRPIVESPAQWADMVSIVARQVWGEGAPPQEMATIVDLLRDALSENGPERRRLKKSNS